MEAKRKSQSFRIAVEAVANDLGPSFTDALLINVTNSTRPFNNANSTTIRLWRGLSYSHNVDVLVDEIHTWGVSGTFPFTFFNGPSLPFSSEAQECPASTSPPQSIVDAARLCTVDAYRSALLELGPSGIARLLGMRSTPGSVAGALPIYRTTLETAAEKEHAADRGNPPRLTVAARALAKHCGRMSPGWHKSYWGEERVVMTGGVESRNRCASKIIERILDDVVWMNVHHAPGGVHVLELRVESGYGARWHVGDNAFRGFLEPHSDEIATKKKANSKAPQRPT